MKVFTVPCKCGMKGCVSFIEFSDDDEKSGNIKMTVRDDKHDISNWVSLDRETVTEIYRIFRLKYKRLE